MHVPAARPEARQLWALGAAPTPGFSHLPGSMDWVWSMPWPGMETGPAGVLQGQGLTALGDEMQPWPVAGWGKHREGWAGTGRADGVSGPWWCEILHPPFVWCQALRIFLEGEDVAPNPSHPEGFPFIPPLLLEDTRVFHFCTFCPPQCKTSQRCPPCTSQGNHCIQVRLVEPSLVLNLGVCLVSMGLCNLPTIISAPVTVCAYISDGKCEIYNVISYYFRINSM